jgi:hypothetical protein
MPAHPAQADKSDLHHQYPSSRKCRFGRHSQTLGPMRQGLLAQSRCFTISESLAGRDPAPPPAAAIPGCVWSKMMQRR